MSETTNYNLHITEDSSERFQDWRNAMNGPDNSNMIKIDTALGQKADKSRDVNATLSSSGWLGSSAPFIQTLAVEGLTSTQNGSINISHSCTFEQRKATRDAILSILSQEDGALVIVADGKKPSMDIPVIITLID